jgi:electron transfer flavoprotein beta subunit
MNIIVCVKLAPDASDIEIKSDGAISLERAEWIIGGFDLQAVEAGVRLVEAHGGQVTVLCAGPRQMAQSRLKKDLLSRGPDALVMVVDERLANAGSALTARVLAGAIQKMGAFDLVLCGEGSSDLYFQQVGLQLGERLGLPTLNAIHKITLEAVPENGSGCILVERDLEDEVEVLDVPLPAVLSVTSDIHEARLPSMKEILKAGKKPVTEWSLADLGLAEAGPANQPEVISTRAPQQKARRQELLSGTPQEAAQKLAEILEREGLV